MIIAIQRIEDYSNLLFKFPGIYFDSGEFIGYKNFHKSINRNLKLADIGMIREKLILNQTGFGVGFNNFFHQFMADHILGRIIYKADALNIF